LLQCLQLVKKKLKSGTPTGDILDAVIAGEDGPINDKVKTDLAKLQSLARLSNGNNDHVKIVCRYCMNFEAQMDGAKLMKCQRCKLVYYCSKECQVTDWKRHKTMCNALTSGNHQESRSTFKTYANTMSAFMDSNYFAIAKEVYKKTQEYNVLMKELFMVIDFFEDAPALRNEFEVWLTSGCIEALSLDDAPHWSRTQTDKKTLTRSLRVEDEQVARNDLLAVCLAS
jgi:hypothetical protein